MMPVHEILIDLHGPWGDFTWEETVLAWVRGVGIWEAVANLHFGIERDVQDAHIHADFGRIDGPGGTLGFSQFPCPWHPPVSQRYDNRENYSLELGPHSGISLPLLIAHEVGHALGLPHLGRGNVMGTPLSMRIIQAAPEDVSEIQHRYGEPVDPPPPPPPDSTLREKLLTGFSELLDELEI